jgi:hypothetical protein
MTLAFVEHGPPPPEIVDHQPTTMEKHAMAMAIVASVGAGGRNIRSDVITVQQLLEKNGVSPGRIDGLCGKRTVDAILRFQARFLSHPDGRVDPGGQTLRRLNGAGGAARTSSPTSTPSAPAPGATTSIRSLVPRPARDTINFGVTAVSPAFMLSSLGQPRSSYSADCQPIENLALKKHITTASVGPFRVSGLAPAVLSLTQVMAQIQREQAEVYRALGTAGMLCCRYVRGSTTAISNHSWGTAIDLTLGGVLDRRGDNKVQLGLTLIASIFNAHGWYWGAAFRTEDAMHFEAGRALIAQWAPTIT